MALYDQVKSQRESLKAQVRAAIDADDLEAVRALFVDSALAGSQSPLTGMQTAGMLKASDESGDNRPPPHG